MTLLRGELLALTYGYLLAAIPVGAAALAGVASPIYRLERGTLLRWWSWGALAIVASAILVYRVLPLLAR